MSERFVCRQCLLGRSDEERCAECGGEEFVDFESDTNRHEFAEALAKRAVARRDKFYLLMKVFVVTLSAVVLFVGLTITHALGGGALDWGVKLLAVALLATSWRAIPQIYSRYFQGRAALLYSRWATEDQLTRKST